MLLRLNRPFGPSLCLTVLRVLVISLTCYFRLVTGVRRRYFVNLLTVCDTRWRSMEPLWNYPPCFGHVALPHQAPLALRVLMLCFVPVLTLDLLPIPFKQFLLQRTLCFLASNSTLSPRNFALILLVSPKSSISLTPGPLNNIILNANYSFPCWQALLYL